MYGLIVLGVAGLYLALMFYVMRSAWRAGRAENGSLLQASCYATIGFLIVFLPIFWNWIPVSLKYRQLCEKDAGFVAHMTPEAWADSNRERIPRVVGMDLNKMTKPRESHNDFSRYEFFGGLLARESREEKFRYLGVDFHKLDNRLLDTLSNKTLSTRIQYFASSREDARIWLIKRSCSGNEIDYLGREEDFLSKLESKVK